MQVVYAGQPFPRSWSRALFLAGPTPRSGTGIAVPSWRPQALEILERMGYDGAVFVPEPLPNPQGRWGVDYIDQIDWETRGLHLADTIVFWVPRRLDVMPAFTTNVEFGRWLDSGKCVLGRPKDAPKMRYLDEIYRANHPDQPICTSLEQTLTAAVRHMGPGAQRQEAERCVPLHLWRTAMFQSWYQNLQRVHHRLHDARVLFVWRRPGEELPMASVLWVSLWSEAEQRYKDNEWVFSRTDTSAVLLFLAPQGISPGIDALLDTEVVLVRELRAPARTEDGYVHELPGGSSPSPGEDPRLVAIVELAEETGLSLAPERLIALGSRQLAATLSSHHAHLFAAALTAQEMAQAHRIAQSGAIHGLASDGERTSVEVTTVRAMLGSGHADWSTLGMLLQLSVAAR